MAPYWIVNKAGLPLTFVQKVGKSDKYFYHPEEIPVIKSLGEIELEKIEEEDKIII